MYKVPGSALGEHSLWIAQDAKGGIWRVDLTHSHTVNAPLKLITVHAGEVRGVAVCPRAHFLASAGADGSLRITSYAKQTVITSRSFGSAATSVIWAPASVCH